LLRPIVIAIYRPPFGKVWKPGNEIESRIYGERIKIRVQYAALSGPKFMSF